MPQDNLLDKFGLSTAQVAIAVFALGGMYFQFNEFQSELQRFETRLETEVQHMHQEFEQEMTKSNALNNSSHSIIERRVEKKIKQLKELEERVRLIELENAKCN